MVADQPLPGQTSSTDRLELLRVARDRLVAAVTGELTCRQCARGVDPPLASVVRELRAVLDEIDRIPGSSEVTPLDRIADGILVDLDQHRRGRGAAG
jgi:hypothetical protein